MADGSLPIEGVDYAFPPHPSPAALVAAGKKFVVRYGGPGTQDKWIHADEAQALAAAGLWIVANAEGSAGGLANGFSAGASWARSADAWFRGIGMPEGRPIYFSIDFDTTTDDWAQLEAAMDGAASVIGRDRVGVYGEYAIVAHLHGTGRAAWSWQTYAWSTGRWYGRNHIEQYLNGVAIDGADCDLNRAMQADYGQWMPGILPTKGDDLMLLYKVKTDAAIYEQRGGYRCHISPELFETLGAANAYQLIEVADEAELLNAVGPEKPTVEGVDFAALVEALKPLVDEAVDAALTAQADAYRAAADTLDRPAAD